MNFLISDTNKNDALYLKQLLISVLNELNYEYKIDCINSCFTTFRSNYNLICLIIRNYDFIKKINVNACRNRYHML